MLPDCVPKPPEGVDYEGYEAYARKLAESVPIDPISVAPEKYQGIQAPSHLTDPSDVKGLKNFYTIQPTMTSDGRLNLYLAITAFSLARVLGLATWNPDDEPMFDDVPNIESDPGEDRPTMPDRKVALEPGRAKPSGG